MERGEAKAHIHPPVGNTWIEAYLDFASQTESPTLYHVWIWMCLVSAALGRKVFHRWGHQIIYPNLYVALVGPTGIRKGVAMSLGVDYFLIPLGIKVAHDSDTPQAFVKWWSQQAQTYTDPWGKARIQTPAIVFSEEMFVFLGEGNTTFMGYLTNLFDGRERPWDKGTIKRGEESIENPFLTACWATAPEWMPKMFTQDVVGGGFTARVIFVTAWEKAKILPDEPSEPDKGKHKVLLDRLGEIQSMQGQVRFSRSALALYKKVYLKQEEDKRNGKLLLGSRMGGYVERRQLYMRKLAMLFASMDLSLQVELAHMQNALDLMLMTEVNMASAFGGLGQSKTAAMEHRIKELLQRRGKVARSELLRIFSGDLDAQTLSAITETLTASGLVSLETTPRGYSLKWEGK